MMYLLYGEDSYRSRKKVREITSRFCALAGSSAGVVSISLPACARGELERQVRTGSLFREKRLVLLEEPCEAPADIREFLESQLPVLASAGDIFVVWDRQPVGATGGAFIKKITAVAAKTQEFGRLTFAQAARFFDKELFERGAACSSADKQQMLAEAQGNSWRLIQLIERHALGGARAPVSELASEKLVFAFTDAYGARHRLEAWRLFHALLLGGMPADRIFWALLSHIRTLIKIGSLVNSGTRPEALAKAAGVHPFTAKKVAGQAGNFSERELIAAYAACAAIDFEEKQSRGTRSLGLERLILTL